MRDMGMGYSEAPEENIPEGHKTSNEHGIVPTTPWPRTESVQKGKFIEVNKDIYLSALKTIGYQTEKVSELGKITVDKYGYSAEVADILGEDYLGSNFIIADHRQRSLEVMKEPFSFLEHISDFVYESLDSYIEYFTKKEPIIAKFIIALPDKTDIINPKLIFSLKCDADTPTGSIGRFVKAREEIEGLTDKLLLDEKKMRSLADEVSQLKKLHGDMMNALSKDMTPFPKIKQYPMDTRSEFKEERWGYTAYYLSTNGRNLVVCFGNYGMPNDLLKDGKDLYLMDGNDKEGVYNAMLGMGILSVDKSKMENLMEDIEKNALKELVAEANKDVSGEKNKNFFKYYSELKKAKENLNGEWYRLKAVLDGKEKLDNLDFDTKLKLSVKLMDTPYLNEVIERLFPGTDFRESKSKKTA